MLIALSNISNLLQNGKFPIFVTIATVIVKLIADFYTWVIVLINHQEEFGESEFHFLAW